MMSLRMRTVNRRKWGRWSCDYNQIEGATGRDIKISVWRPAGWADQKDYDWSVQIDAAEMELLESKNGVMYQAPTTGYLPAWKFAQKAGKENYVRKVNPKFF